MSGWITYLIGRWINIKTSVQEKKAIHYWKDVGFFNCWTAGGSQIVYYPSIIGKMEGQWIRGRLEQIGIISKLSKRRSWSSLLQLRSLGMCSWTVKLRNQLKARLRLLLYREGVLLWYYIGCSDSPKWFLTHFIYGFSILWILEDSAPTETLENTAIYKKIRLWKCFLSENKSIELLGLRPVFAPSPWFVRSPSGPNHEITEVP